LTLETRPYILLLRVDHQEITNRTERVSIGFRPDDTAPRGAFFLKRIRGSLTDEYANR